MSRSNRCRICGGSFGVLLQLPRREPSHCFFSKQDLPRLDFALAYSECSGCGSVQTTEPITETVLGQAPRWLTLSEPEAHLNGLFAGLAQHLDGLNTFACVSKNDRSLARRFESIGCKEVVLDWTKLIGADQDPSAMNLQSLLSSCDLRVEQSADLVICRNFIEHLAEPILGCANLTKLVNPGGYLLIEVPLHERAFEVLDYSVLWEEHNLLPTKPAFEVLLSRFGAIERTWQYEYGNFTYFVALLKVGPGQIETSAVKTASFFSYASSIVGVRKKWLERLDSGKKSLAFGAGHLFFNFLSVLALGDCFEAFIDDHPHKVGTFAPTSRLPILSSDALSRSQDFTCFHALSSETLENVKFKYALLLESGGHFEAIN